MAGVFRAAFGYVFLIFLTRIVGRRPGKQLTPFEFVIIFFIGGLTLTYIVGDDRSLTNALCQITTIALVHFIIAWLRQRFPRFAIVADGTPLVLMKKSEWLPETLYRMGIQDDDVMASARDKGIANLEAIEYAVVERNGEISILEKSED